MTEVHTGCVPEELISHNDAFVLEINADRDEELGALCLLIEALAEDTVVAKSRGCKMRAGSRAGESNGNTETYANSRRRWLRVW